jgi:hypothetical protein
VSCPGGSCSLWGGPAAAGEPPPLRLCGAPAPCAMPCLALTPAEITQFPPALRPQPVVHREAPAAAAGGDGGRRRRRPRRRGAAGGRGAARDGGRVGPRRGLRRAQGPGAARRSRVWGRQPALGPRGRPPLLCATCWARFQTTPAPAPLKTSPPCHPSPCPPCRPPVRPRRAHHHRAARRRRQPGGPADLPPGAGRGRGSRLNCSN